MKIVCGILERIEMQIVSEHARFSNIETWSIPYEANQSARPNLKVPHLSSKEILCWNSWGSG
jgi:hypothetical protein